MLLQEVKALLADDLNEDVVDVVITVPGYFSHNQRQATVGSALIAGFNVLRLQSETVAAILAAHDSLGNGHILVVDFGAGKLDLSLVKKEEGVLTILRTAGSTQFGGIDLDSVLADAVGPDLPRRQLLFECHKARHLLSAADSAVIQVGHIRRILTRLELNRILAASYQKLTDGLNELFDGNSFTPGMVDEIHFVGGMTQVSEVRDLIADYFGQRPKVVRAALNATAVGAAMEGAIQKGITHESLCQVKVQVTVPLSIGFSLADGTIIVMIPRGTVLPAKKRTRTTTSRDDQRNVGFDIIEGERKLAKDNVKLGSIFVDGIERAPKGVPKIDISMEVNEDGILVVEAKDLKTGALIQTTLRSGTTLSKEQIAQMVADAAAHKEEDERAHKRAVWRTKLHYYVKGLNAAQCEGAALQKQFQEKIEEWKTWNQEHENEEDPDIYIAQLKTVAGQVRQMFLAVPG
jgi:molecular chaperone DnaK (HSP70)